MSSSNSSGGIYAKWISWKGLMLQSAVYVLLMAIVEAIGRVNAGNLLSSSRQMRVVPSILAVLAMLAGFFVCFYGYKWFRPTVFFGAFVTGGLILALAFELIFGSFAWIGLVSWILFLVGGFFSGCVVLWIYALGVTLVGAGAGIILGFVMNASVGYLIIPSTPDVMLVVFVVVFAVAGAYAAWFFEKPVLIVATSFVGAQAVMWGLGYFAGGYPSGADLEYYRRPNGHGGWHYDIPNAWWGYLGGSVALFLLGVYVQFFRTARGIRRRPKPKPEEQVEPPAGYSSTHTPHQTTHSSDVQV